MNFLFEKTAGKQNKLLAIVKNSENKGFSHFTILLIRSDKMTARQDAPGRKSALKQNQGNSRGENGGGTE